MIGLPQVWYLPVVGAGGGVGLDLKEDGRPYSKRTVVQGRRKAPRRR